MHYLFLDGSCVFERMPFFLPFSPTVHLVQVKKCCYNLVDLEITLYVQSTKKEQKQWIVFLFRKMWVMLTSNTIQAKPSPQTSLQLVTLGEKDSAPEYHPAS